MVNQCHNRPITYKGALHVYTCKLERKKKVQIQLKEKKNERKGTYISILHLKLTF